MKLKNLLSLLVFFPIFTACIYSDKNKNRQDIYHTGFLIDSMYVFDLSASIGRNPADTFVLNSIVDRVQFIPLETSKQSFFDNYAYRLTVTAENYFISGGVLNNKIIQFDHVGNYISEVVRTGRGPGELPIIMRWNVNKTLNMLYALDHKVVIKSFTNGDIFDVVFENMPGYSIALLNDGSFVFAKQAGLGKRNADIPYLTFYDSHGKVIRSVHYTYNRDVDYDLPEGEANPNEFYRLETNYRDDALFYDIYNDTIFCIKNKNSIIPYVVLERGKYFPNIKDIRDKDRKAKQIYFRAMMETEKFFVIKYYYNKLLYTDFWDKSSLNVVSRTETSVEVIQQFNARYKLPDGSETILNILNADKDKLYCLLEASEVRSFIDIAEDANPVIMILHLKP